VDFQIFAAEGSPANAVNGLWKAAWWRSSCIDFANFLRFFLDIKFRKKGGEGREEFAFFVSTLLAVKSPLLKTYV
jgi:hypothetical protein